jgi:hypothetical protein
MYPEHKELFDSVKAANAADFAELHRLIANIDRLVTETNAIVAGWNQ